MRKIAKRAISGMLTLIFIVTACFSIPIVSNAASRFETVKADTVIDSKYSFSPRFITGVTTLETFGATSTYEDDCWSTTNSYNQTYRPIRLTSTSQKGKVGAIYHNVGEYQGKQVDLKITIMDWDELNDPYKIESVNKISYPCVAFNGRAIGIGSATPTIKKPVYRFEFQQNGKTISLAGHMTFNDIDVNQYIECDTFDDGYLTANTDLHILGNKVYAKDAGDQKSSDTRYWITYTWDAPYFEFAYNDKGTDDRDFSKPVSYRGISSMTIIGDSLAPFDTPAPVKSGADSVISGEELSYNIAFTVPQQPDNTFYKEFVLSDTIPDGLTYKGFKVKDDAGSDVTGKFTGSIKGQDFTLIPKNLTDSSFYFKGYTVTIHTFAEDKDYADFQGENGKVILKNTAKISAQIETIKAVKTSNEVNTEVFFKINTKTDGNGTITESISGISGGSDKTITYTPNAGYEIDTVTVDGKQVEKADSYTFNDISKNHDISVTFKPADRNLSINKVIEAEDVNLSYGDPVAIFKVEGEDVEGIKHQYEYIVKLKYIPEDSTTHKEYAGKYFGNVSEIVPAGNYTLSEVKTSHYDVEDISAENGKVENDSIVFDLINNEDGKGTFVNSIKKHNTFSHCHVIDNWFFD